jgi:hypothetical protein
MARKKTIQAFEEWAKDPANVEDLLREVGEGVKLREACLSAGKKAGVNLPYTLVYQHLHGDAVLKARYEGAKAGVAENMVDETIEIADAVGGSESPAEVMAAKLRCEVREKAAKAWNRERYGGETVARVQVNLSLGDVAKEVRELEARLGIAAALPVQALPAKIEAEDAVLVEAGR